MHIFVNNMTETHSVTWHSEGLLLQVIHNLHHMGGSWSCDS